MIRYSPKYITVTYPFFWRIFQLKRSLEFGIDSLISIQKNGQTLAHQSARYEGERAASVDIHYLYRYIVLS